MNNAINWFEIPATNLQRAQDFYEAIFGISLVPMDMPGIKMRMFPIDDPMNGVGGAIVESSDFQKPSAEGTLIYLNGNPDLQQVLDKVKAAGGSVVMPKTEISPEYGFMGVVLDTEGNRVGVHSMQ
ncbi:MAG: VOC family protein [Ferruginibacter sp.]